MSLEILQAKRRRRTRFLLDRSRYTKQLHICNHMTSKATYHYYTNFISMHSENPRQLWKSINAMLHRDKPKVLPDSSSLDTLCMSSRYFTDKIVHIRSRFVIKDVDCHVAQQPVLAIHTFLHLLLGYW